MLAPRITKKLFNMINSAQQGGWQAENRRAKEPSDHIAYQRSNSAGKDDQTVVTHGHDGRDEEGLVADLGDQDHYCHVRP